jgi:hypothetical protein
MKSRIWINKSFKINLLVIYAAIFADSSWGADQATQSWLMSNNIASFTFTGTQSGFTAGTVYTLSTAGNSLGFCTLTPPTPGSSQTQYTTSCFTDYGTILSGGGTYSAVAFLGTQNNPTASFIVGDSSGNLSIATPNFQQNSNGYVVSSLNMTDLPSCPSGTAVANLALDPTGYYVYIGCYSATTNPILVTNPNNKYTYNLPGYTLYSALVTSSSNGVIVGPYTLQTYGNNAIFSVPGNSQQANNQIAAVWPGVSPVMRTYPSGFPGLEISAYASSGGVLVSGLVDQVSGDNSGSANNGPLSISNAAIMCSGGICSVVNSTSQPSGQPAQIVTAFEIGMDSYGGGNALPAIYTSSFSLADNQVWSQNCPPADDINSCESASTPPFYGTIYWKNVSPTISSCSSTSGPLENLGIFCGNYSQTLIWPPNGMPTPGNGYQIDVTNLTYVPVPATNNSPFTQGLLLIGTWTNGYLAYHSPANYNRSTGLFLNQVNGGNIGNVNAITADNNGNILFQTGSQGLYAMNPFIGTNTATGTDTTLIQQPADSSSSGASSWTGTLADASEFVYYTVQTIKVLAVASAVKPQSVHLKEDAKGQGETFFDGLTPRYSLLGPFNRKSYHGQFVYTQSQLESLGLEPGEVVQGLRFRNAEGFVSSPTEDLRLNRLKITLSEAPLNQELKPNFSANLGKNRKVVKGGPMTLFKDGLPSSSVYPDQSVGTGIYGQLIPFRKPYRYQGGNLLVDFESSGKADNYLLSVDAFGTKAVQGLYKTPKTKQPRKLKSVPALDFVK